jgi:hypothetical protein
MTGRGPGMCSSAKLCAKTSEAGLEGRANVRDWVFMANFS